MDDEDRVEIVGVESSARSWSVCLHDHRHHHRHHDHDQHGEWAWNRLRMRKG